MGRNDEAEHGPGLPGLAGLRIEFVLQPRMPDVHLERCGDPRVRERFLDGIRVLPACCDRGDQHLIDTVCPWYGYRIGWTFNKNHITRIPVPFVTVRNKIFHRLTLINVSDSASAA